MTPFGLFVDPIPTDSRSVSQGVTIAVLCEASFQGRPYPPLRTVSYGPLQFCAVYLMTR